MPLIPALKRVRQVDLKARLVYRASSRSVNDTQRYPVLKNTIIIVISVRCLVGHA